MSPDRKAWPSLAAGALVAMPAAASVWYLFQHPEVDAHLQVPVAHFYVVSVITLLAAILSAVVSATAVRLRDARALIMALGFLLMTGLFLTHALTTPGVLVGPNPWVSLSSTLGLWLGTVSIAASSMTLGKRLEDHLSVLAGPAVIATIIGLVAYGAVALATSPPRPAAIASASQTQQSYDAGSYQLHQTHGYDDDAYGYVFHSSEGDYADVDDAADRSENRAPGTTSPATGWAALNPLLNAATFLSGNRTVALAGTGVSGLLLLLALLRYWHGYRLSRTWSHAATAVGLILMAEALVPMTLGQVWRLSWWSYHVMLLLSFGVMMSPALVGWVRGGSLTSAMERLFVRELLAQLQAGYTEATRALVAALEARDHYTRGHSERVAEYAVRLGQAMGLPPERLRLISQAALLHDVGKLGIPDAVLNKPGPLNEAEWALIRQHPDLGATMLESLPSLQEERRILRHHHERLDGSGYPDGLRGEAIPLESRIIAVADVFDALTSNRAYRTAWSHDRALAYLQTNAGTHLDPACVDAFLRVMRPGAAPSSVPSARPGDVPLRVHSLV